MKRIDGKLLNSTSIPAPEAPESAATDLMRLPILGRLFAWRYARPVLQAPLLVVSVVMILHGLFGPTLAPKNLATTLTWLHFRGVLVLVLLAAGNFFCLACPFMLVRNAARRLFKPWMIGRGGYAISGFDRAVCWHSVRLRVV